MWLAFNIRFLLGMFENSSNPGKFCNTVLVLVSYLYMKCFVVPLQIPCVLLCPFSSSVSWQPGSQCWLPSCSVGLLPSCSALMLVGSPELQCTSVGLLPREISSQLSPPHSHLPPHVQQPLAKKKQLITKIPEGRNILLSIRENTKTEGIGTNPYCEFPPAIGRSSEGFISRQVSGLLYLRPSTLFPHNPSCFHMGES